MEAKLKMHRCRTNSARSFDRCVVATVAWTVLVLSGCGGNSSNQNKLLSIKVDPASSSLAVGAQLQYKAQGNFADGIPSELQQVAYSSSNVNIATITSGGLATGVAPGSATITAMSGGASGTATLNVEVQPDLLTITILPPSSTIGPQATEQLVAQGTYSDGSTQVLTSSANWSSSDTGVATIVPGGVVTGVAAGSTTITATSGSISGTASLAVN
jgi:uncharacterized protein YjdB